MEMSTKLPLIRKKIRVMCISSIYNELATGLASDDFDNNKRFENDRKKRLNI